MVQSTQQLEAQLLTLPPADRARLAEILLSCLDAEIEAGPVAAAADAWPRADDASLSCAPDR